MDSSEEGASITQGDSKPWNRFRGGASGNIVGYSGRVTERTQSPHLDIFFRLQADPFFGEARSKDTAALSTAEAEYAALSSAAHNYLGGQSISNGNG